MSGALFYETDLRAALAQTGEVSPLLPLHTQPGKTRVLHAEPAGE